MLVFPNDAVRIIPSLCVLHVHTGSLQFDFFLKDVIYLFMRDTEREAETQAEGEAGSTQGAGCRTQSQDWVHDRRLTKADTQLLSHPSVPKNLF